MEQLSCSNLYEELVGYPMIVINQTQGPLGLHPDMTVNIKGFPKRFQLCKFYATVIQLVLKLFWLRDVGKK